MEYWARTGLVEPSLRITTGSTDRPLYSFKDLVLLKIVIRLLNTDIALKPIRVFVAHVRESDIEDLAKMTLFYDGTTVYESTSPEDVVDLLQGGQGVVGIAVSAVMREVKVAMTDFPPERAERGTKFRPRAAPDSTKQDTG